jgi:hypothetical protein
MATFSSESYSEAERIELIEEIITKNAPLPGKVVDVDFAEFPVGDAKSDFRFFARIEIDPREVDHWKSALEPGTVNFAPQYKAPDTSVAWWLPESEFISEKVFQPGNLFGRINGWVLFSEDSKYLWVYTFTM